MRGLLWLVRACGYSGLVLCIDEIEELAKLSPRKRQDQALQALREYVDHAGGEGGYRNLCMYLAATPEMFEGEQYFPRYDALATRIQPLSNERRLGGRVLSIHSRRAGREVLAFLAEHTTPERVLPILHWFSDSVATATEAARFGCYFSINHRMLVTEAGISLIKSLPADRLLTETDGPFSEIENRKSEPRDVAAMISRLAQLRNLPVGDMKRTIAANAERVLAFAGVSIPVSDD